MTSIEDITVGDQFVLEKEPTRPQLFRFSAITWNPHRIHYDPEYAREVEGHPDILVQAHFHGASIQQLLFERLPDEGQLAELGWSNRGRAVPDDELIARAEITSINEEDRRVEFDVWTESDNGRCAEGTAAFVFPE